jgi:cyclopropane-fatty-acyl-phospholipid synthase
VQRGTVSDTYLSDQPVVRPSALSARSSLRNLAAKLAKRSTSLPCSIVVHTAAGEPTVLGSGEPVLFVYARNKRGERALRGLSLLEICEAYIHGDIDLEGDLIRAASFQGLLSDRQIWLRIWRQLQPRLVGRTRTNPSWIAKHYDQNNIQLIAADREYHTYTPGIYCSDSDSLEAGAVRKLDTAFRALRLDAGKAALDIGCGWGGFMRYCASKKVEVTGITLSRDQFGFVEKKLRNESIPATVLYQDFFTFKPDRKYDGISLMGVLEDLSDYRLTIKRLADWVKPAGRIYLDFAAARERFGTSSFITKYIWPGLFRMVYMPELVAAIWQSPFEIVECHNDRVNYHLWARQSYSRWMEQKAAITERASEALWRTFRIMHAGTASVMSHPANGVSAYRMVLELPGS